MTDQTPPAETAPEAPQTEAPQEGQPQESQPDILGQINTRLDQWGQELPNMVAQAVADQGFYEPEQGYDSYQQQQQGFQQPEQDPYGGLDPNDPIQARLIQAEQRLQQLDQGSQRVQTDLWSRDLQGVLDRYPELNPSSETHNPQASQTVMNSLRQAGFDVNGMVPIQAIEMAYKAFRADQIANSQTPVDQQQAVTLESGNAQAQQPEPDPAEQIFGKSEGPPNPIFSWAVR